MSLMLAGQLSQAQLTACNQGEAAKLNDGGSVPTVSHWTVNDLQTAKTARQRSITKC